MWGEPAGTIDFTTTGASNAALVTGRTVNASGVALPVRIFHIHLISGGSGGTQLIIADGSSGTQRINITGTTSKGIDFDFGVMGVTFDKGAYITSDSNLVNAAITMKTDFNT